MQWQYIRELVDSLCSRDGPLGLGLEVSWTFCSVKISCEKNESSICDALPEREAFWIIEPYVHTLLRTYIHIHFFPMALMQTVLPL